MQATPKQKIADLKAFIAEAVDFFRYGFELKDFELSAELFERLRVVICKEIDAGADSRHVVDVILTLAMGIISDAVEPIGDEGPVN
jgi:hypothetical protein